MLIKLNLKDIKSTKVLLQPGIIKAKNAETPLSPVDKYYYLIVISTANYLI